MSGAPRAELWPAIERLVVALSQAISARTIYPAGHSQTRDAIARTSAATEHLLAIEGGDAIPLLLAGGELVVGGRPLPHGTLFQRGLIEQFERRQIGGLTLARGLGDEELTRFLDGLVSGGALQPTPHIAVGRVEVVAGGTGGDFESEAAGEELRLTANLGAARDVLHEEVTAAGARRRKALDLARFELAVEPLVLALPQGTITLPDLPAGSGGEGAEALFQHAVRVALLSLALGRALGLSGPRLAELGVAALLHDVGKLELPQELLSRPPRDAVERALLATHPARGAALLARSEGESALASLVAYEHHLRWDGKPSYPALSAPRRPLLASQVVAVADTYDLAKSASSGTPQATHQAALAFVNQRRGTWLEAGLVAAFGGLFAGASGSGAERAG